MSMMELSGLLKLTELGVNMPKYQFRTNWRGKLVLQCKDYNRDHWGDKYYYWRDATTEDLKDYYEQLCKLQAPCACQEQRRRFDASCG